MNKILPVMLFAAAVFIGCGKNEKESSADNKSNTKAAEEIKVIKPESLFGSWVNKESEMGFTIMEGGRAASINMATLAYNSWQLIENKMVLNSTSKGVSNPVTADEIYIIRDITPVMMILSPSNNPNTKWNYEKKQ